LQGRDFPAVLRHFLPLAINIGHLRPIIAAIDLNLAALEQTGKRINERAGIDEQAANAPASNAKTVPTPTHFGTGGSYGTSGGVAKHFTFQEMQNELNTPPFPTAGQRAAIVNSIKRINNQIAEKQKELDLCVQQCSGKPSIFFFCNFYRACTIGIV